MLHLLSGLPASRSGRARTRHGWRVLAVLGVLASAGCTRFPEARFDLEPGERTIAAADDDAGRVAVTTPAAGSSEPEAEPGFYAPGNDRLTAVPRRGPRKPGAAPGAAPGAPPAGGVTLNFENTNLLEVVKVVLGDLLGLSYVVDPAVQGSVTLQSSTPIPRDALLPTLEMLLRMNGAALTDSGGTLSVVPRDRALRSSLSPQLGDSTTPLPRGFRVQVVPLRFVSAGEMQAILEPLVEPGSVVRVDSLRNLLVLAVSSGELEQVLEAVALFDVDWMAGMSVALFRPDFVAADTLAEELAAVLGTDVEGPLDGLVRFVVIERLNGLLVVTPRRQYLARVREWVRRLDQSGGGVGQRLFVYHVQNGKAAELAEVLGQVFQEEGRERVPVPSLAPGLEPATLASEAEAPTTPGSQDAEPGQAAASPPGARGRASAVPTPGEGVALSPDSEVRIIADEVNNALLIMATADEYKQVEAALLQLDIAPLQVLIEATIAEVSLEDELSQGIEWFLKNTPGNNSFSGRATLDLNDSPALGAILPGFSYTVTDAAGVVRAVINTLATESKARIISSPSLMVLNNQKATIQVGDQVPITTQQQQSTSTASNIVNSIEFRDTGVLLSVTPRVNAGGLVIMEVEQEVSNVAPTGGSSLTPTIQQRKINSTVAVQSGETVVLGGLIRENDVRTGSGIPGLREVPVFGWFFGASTDELTRSELVVLITPRAVRGPVEARQVTDEFRRKMDSLKPSDEPPRGFGPFFHKLENLGSLAPSGVATGGETRDREHDKRRERVLDLGRPSRADAKEPGPAERAPVSLAPPEAGAGTGIQLRIAPSSRSEAFRR